jgi:hypothetical protein
MCGGGGMHHFNIVAKNPGRSEIVFSYGRSWDTNDQSIVKYIVSVQ